MTKDDEPKPALDRIADALERIADVLDGDVNGITSIDGLWGQLSRIADAVEDSNESE